MEVIQHVTRSWWLLAATLTVALVPAAAAQARHAQPIARSAMRSARATRSFVRGGTGVDHGSLVPSAAGRIGANANPTTFTDATGDSGTVPDITSVVVGNDPSGQIAFSINVAKLVVPSNYLVGVAIDSDQNVATGDLGVDYLFIVDLSSHTFEFDHWVGSDWVSLPTTTTNVWVDGNTVNLSINSSELGHTTAFNFWARTTSSQGGTSDRDDAPDSGSWSYELAGAAPLKLSVELSHATKARAGKAYLATITVARSDSAPAAVSAEDVTCAATVGARPLHASLPTARGAVADCAWHLPTKSKGKKLRASVTVTLDGATVTKRFAAKIT